MKTDTAQRVEELLARPYRREIVPEVDGTWIAAAPELKGCLTAGDTPAQALEMLQDAMAAWLATALELGRPVPEPGVLNGKAYSGRFNLRVPTDLHRQLAERAARNKSSLNEYCVYLLAEGVAGE
jgi:predicted RNase H-like HicB family nuclease